LTFLVRPACSSSTTFYRKNNYKHLAGCQDWD
jgi:hypothetical protein